MELKARLLKIRLAGVNTPFEKNKLKRELSKDVAGNPAEQDIFDMLSESASETSPGADKSKINRAISKGMRSKKFKKTGTFSFMVK